MSALIRPGCPTAPFPTVAGGAPPTVPEHYRLKDGWDESKVTPEDILAPHRQRTPDRRQ